MKRKSVRSFHPIRIMPAALLFGFALTSIAAGGGLEAVFREPRDMRLLLRAVQSELLPASGAVTQNVGSVFFEPLDEDSSRWLRQLRSSSSPDGFPVLVFEDAGSLDIVATNLESGSSATIDPDPDESPLWALEPLEAFDPDIRDRLAPYFEPSLVSVRFVLFSPAVAMVQESDANPVPAEDGADGVLPSNASDANAPPNVRDPSPARIDASGTPSTNAPTRVAVPVVRHLIFSPSAVDARLSLRTDVPRASSISVRETVSVPGLDVRGRAGVVRIDPGATLSLRTGSGGPCRTVCIPPGGTVAPPFAPTGTVSAAASPRQDSTP